MSCIFAAFEICHRSHSPLCSLFQIPKPTKIQVKIAQLILLPLLMMCLAVCASTVTKLRISFFSPKEILIFFVECRVLCKFEHPLSKP